MMPTPHMLSAASSVIHHVARAGAHPLTALTSARWSLEGRSDFWSLVLQLSTIAIGIGVLVEVVATGMEIVEDRAAGKKLPLHAILTLLGGAVIAVALATEFWAEFKTSTTETALRSNNAAAQGELDKRARDATAQAVVIATKFGGLKTLVAQKTAEMDATVQQFGKRTDKAIVRLTTQETSLQKAQRGALSSAGKAAGAADIANKTAASMADVLNSERQMQAQMRAIITHRTFTQNEADALAAKLKPFAGTPFDFCVANDADSQTALLQLGAVLETAGWKWKDGVGCAKGLMVTFPGKPIAGLTSKRGIELAIAESARPKLEKPVILLRDGLSAIGWPGVTADATPDAKMDKSFAPDAVHILVGTRD